MNILSGLYPTTSGDASIQGHSVVTDLAAAQRHMGVCPQDSVIWPELSAREHLKLFGSLRNLHGDALDRAVDLALKQVCPLSPFLLPFFLSLPFLTPLFPHPLMLIFMCRYC